MAKDPKYNNKDLPIVPEKELKKAHEAVAITPKSGKGLTLLGRNVYNILLFHAQEQSQIKPDQSRYRIQLKEITSIAEFNSNDTGLIKQYLKQMLTTVVEWNTVAGSEQTSWEACALLSYAKLEKVQGSLWLVWSYDESIKEKLLVPDMYARISLGLHFASGHAKALYETGARYADNPGKITMRNPWQWWRPVLTGVPDERAVTYLEYKYFKRDVINTALREVNARTDIDMALIEHAVGRKVVDIQFSVERKAQAALPLTDVNIIDMNLLSRMLSLGLTQKEAEQIYSNTEEAILRATIENTESRMKRSPPLGSPAAYMKDALKKGYIRVKPALQATSDKPKGSSGATSATASLDKATKSFKQKRSNDAEAMFAEMDMENQEEKLDEWAGQAEPAALRPFGSMGLKSKQASVSFFSWLAQDTWGDVTPEDLLQFVLDSKP